MLCLWQCFDKMVLPPAQCGIAFRYLTGALGCTWIAINGMICYGSSVKVSPKHSTLLQIAVQRPPLTTCVIYVIKCKICSVSISPLFYSSLDQLLRIKLDVSTIWQIGSFKLKRVFRLAWICSMIDIFCVCHTLVTFRFSNYHHII